MNELKLTKFTKGEWKIATCGSNVSVWSDNESIIDPMTIDYPMAEDKERVVANAHLIAAAPDMYELLERIGKAERIWSVDEMYALLSKARGE